MSGLVSLYSFFPSPPSSGRKENLELKRISFWLYHRLLNPYPDHLKLVVSGVSHLSLPFCPIPEEAARGLQFSWDDGAWTRDAPTPAVPCPRTVPRRRGQRLTRRNLLQLPGCPIPRGCRTSLTAVFLLKPLGLEQNWSRLLVPKSSQLKSLWVQAEVGWRARTGFTVGKPSPPTVPPSLTLFIHGLMDSSIRFECSDSAELKSREAQLHQRGSGPCRLPTSTSRHSSDSQRERQAGARRNGCCSPGTLRSSPCRCCPPGGNRARPEPSIGEVMVQTGEDPSPDHSE